MKNPGFATRAIHESALRKDAFRPLRFPVFAGVAFDFESAEAMADSFFGRGLDFAYSRISNPTVDVFERTMTALEGGFASVAVSSGKVPLIADGTVTTPYLFNAARFGVNIVVHSTTKYISGGATSMGGVIVDLGNFDWSSIPSLQRCHRFNEHAFIARLRKEVYRETGSCLSPHDAYLQTLGLETLSLRMEKICHTAQTIAEFLTTQESVTAASYSGLASSPYHDLAARQFNGLHGGVLSFLLQDRESAFRFLNGLALVKRATNLGDNKTLAIHPASTIFAGVAEEEMNNLGIEDGLIRISAGIEDADDLIDDIREALKGIGA
jgi:O-acetylhomoserine (thiol)-lyase